MSVQKCLAVKTTPYLNQTNKNKWTDFYIIWAYSKKNFENTSN